MPIVPSDLPLQWSTRFETLFLSEYNQSVAVAKKELQPLYIDMPMNDHEGNTVTMDWLGAAPQLEKWVDEKKLRGLNKQEWTVKVLDYDASIGIDLRTFRDARGNVYEPRIREMAQNGSRLRYNLLSDLILGGHTGVCYDGSNFFDVTHSEGKSGTQSNYLTGTGTSVAQITADYFSAYSALVGFKDDQGVPFQPAPFRPTVWIPNVPSLIQNFRTLQSASLISTTSNVLMSQFDVIIDPRLTWTSNWAMFRTDGVMRPFGYINREEPHYIDNFGSGQYSDDVFLRKMGTVSCEGRGAAFYWMWQKGAMINNGG